MEVRQILQAIGMEATVLAFLFGVAFAAIRITRAEKNAKASGDQTYATISTDRHPY
jgi:Kef-type K+ transport system membrane component KefB